MQGGGDHPVAKEVEAMALPLAINDEKLRIKGLRCWFGVLPVHLWEDLLEVPILFRRQQAIELSAILPIMDFFPGLQDVDQATKCCLLQN